MFKTKDDFIYEERMRLTDEFNKNTGLLLKLASTRMKGDDSFEKIQRKITIGKMGDDEIVLKVCYKNLCKHKLQIRNYDENFFLNLTAEKYYNHEDKSDIVPLINLFNSKKNLLTNNEKKYIFDILNKMLNICLQYKLLKDDTKTYDQYMNVKDTILK